MSVCRSTLGAITRPRVITTLVPFLYQTATIQRSTHPAARRHASGRPHRNDDVPFEDPDSLPSDRPPPRKSTLTGSELAAFEKLYKKFSKEEEQQRQHDIPFAHDAEPTAEPGTESLDSVFDAVLAGSLPPQGRRPRNKPSNKPSKKPTEDLKTPDTKEAAADADNVKRLREEHRSKIHALLSSAETDHALWQILEREVFAPIRALDLDGPATLAKSSHSKSSHKKSSHKNPAKPLSSDPATTAIPPEKILFQTFPTHLLTAVSLLRQNFPTSSLALNLLPTIKALGRSAYALGATTALYNQLIETVWTQFSSFDYLDELLTDMGNGGIECDARTVALLRGILDECARAQRGEFGDRYMRLYRMNAYVEGMGKVKGWKKFAEERLAG